MNGDNPKAYHNRVCRLAIEKIGDKLKQIPNKNPSNTLEAFNLGEKVGYIWMGLKAIHKDCEEGLNNQIFEDEWMEHKYLDVIDSFDDLAEKLKKYGFSFGDIDTDNINVVD